jgi:phosphatidylserine/phosphatidylglycerophosphate/cardiolipin synthase-like enzyme
MAEYLTVRAAISALERLAQRAQRRVVLISPYIKFPRTLESSFKQAAKRGVEIVVVCREKDLRREERDRLVGLGRVTLYFLEELHAKCYCNEEELLIGSLNLYDHSEQNNFEMTVRLSREGDSEAFSAAKGDVEYIIEEARRKTGGPLTRIAKAAASAVFPRGPKSGFCIRCAKAVVYTPTAPLCEKCYESWATWGNVDYPEDYCHRCGRERATSKAKPLCPKCFSSAPFTTANFG